MDKIWIIMQREYITRVRKKAFILTTLLAPLGFFAISLSSILIGSYSSSDKHVAIIDKSGLFADVVFADAPDGSVLFQREKDTTGIRVHGKDGKEAKLDAVVEIPATFNLDNPSKVSIICLSEKSVGIMSQSYINTEFSEKIRILRAQKLNIAQDQLENLNKNIKLEYTKLDEKDRKKEGSALLGAGLGYAFGIMIYILLLVYGTMIMKGVAEEKSNRIMEVLVSSVKPLHLMLGKIIGIAAVGLTQFVLWIILSVCTFLVLPVFGLVIPSHMQNMPHSSMSNADFDPDNFQSVIAAVSDFHFGPVIAVMMLFFLGGFLLYGSLFAAIGAAGGDETDSQSLTLPVTMPIIISFMIMMNVISQPEGKLAFWSSMIPFCSPIIMPALMPSHPPLWHIALSFVFLMIGFVLCAMLAAKIYRTGILMYGKKVSFQEIGRWIFAKN